MAEKGDLGWRIVSGAVAFAGGFVARKAITLAWRKSTGKEPPENPESPEVALKEALTWAVLVGVGVQVIRILVIRAAAKRWMRGTGELPAPLRLDD